MTPSGRFISPRKRVNQALNHQQPDMTPVDFLAVPEIWESLIQSLAISEFPNQSEYYDSRWEGLLRKLHVDCRVISYDQFPSPPADGLIPGAKIDWYSSLGRSTPNRMWRQITPDEDILDIWGRIFRVKENPYGAYEEISRYPLSEAQSVNDCQDYPWPEPDWWDFSGVPDLLSQLDDNQEYHLRYRMGSIFEIAWQLRGMDNFLLDMALDSKIPLYIMERLTEVFVEITKRFLAAAGDRIDMVYFYDDVATQESLLISKDMWRKQIYPYHQRLVDAGKSQGRKVMYHCDGAIYPLIPSLLDMGVDVLNPIQADAKDMNPARLKNEFGDRLSFHGGIDIIDTLPNGTPARVQNEVQARIKDLSMNGGYIVASSHHIQADTPLENILAMYDLKIR